ncbi:VCBS repeat-containing protein [Nitrosomonas ureae]|uniref:FG-GAP repeat-containing protein n=1 Tax=Nitrosomonas ureae TaxID=44577 RepID=A0A1H2DRW4_9PROT|nr:VCBS repeat-containing protein [Nitrosomonas ureae]ALQ50861.1 hypothetical protein ATY38_06225 [Nitrosomonas ureae]SDT85615.1 FG-GAP repeat-containing protein [Nitrosomonas ureae]
MATTSIDLADLDGSNGFRLNAETGYSFRSVSNAGDVNGDGLDDVSISISGDASRGYSSSGYVVFGKAAGFDAETNLSELDGSNGFRLNEGNSLEPAGDVNGDGFDDVIIGAGNHSYVVFGRASGFDAEVDLSSLDGSDGFRLEKSKVSAAGDVNGDGFDDVIIGAGNYSYVVFGRASGFDAEVDLSNLDGSNGFGLHRVDSGRLVINTVSPAGDFNGDGFDDVIVFFDTVLGKSDGYVVFGKSTGIDAMTELSSLDGSNGFHLKNISFRFSDAGDVNGDDFDDLIIGAGNYSYVVFGRASGFEAEMDLFELSENGFRVDALAPRDGFGSSVSAAGDVNGDGFDDVIIGAPGGSGSSYVVFGQASGFDATVNLMSLNGALENGHLGSSVSGAGDVNGDGFDDLMVSAGGDIIYRGVGDTTYYTTSSGYVIFGSSDFTGLTAYLGTSADDTLTGTPAAEIFYAREGKDTLISGGGADTIFGGTGRDTIRVSDPDFLLVDGGNDHSGFVEDDTLELDGGGMNLDLTAADHKVIDIETIDLSGTGDNVLTLTAADVLDLSSSTDILTVKGDAGDRVAGLSSGWVDRGFKGELHMFSAQNEAVLMVADAVSTDFVDGGHMVISDLNGDNGFRLDGAAGHSSGGSVSNAGDVNGDGFDDVIIGATGAGGFSGSSYVVFGKASGFDATMNLSGLDGSNGFRLNGVANNDSSGVVSSAGDVNGDGFDDVIIGAPGADNNDLSSGSSYIVFGKASGFDATMNLSGLDGSNGFRLDGEVLREYSGLSVSNAGDVNGDGFDDVIIGAPGADPNNSNFDDEGSSYVVFGKASGFDAAMNLSTLDGSNGFRLDGESFSGQAGTSVSTAGDVNGDGFDDVIIGTGNSSYVVFGKAVGFDAAMSLSDLNGSNGFRMKGGTSDILAGSVSNAGDVNGDGFDDLIISTRGIRVGDYYYGYTNTRGGSYVVFGKEFGFDAVMDLSILDGSDGFRLNEEGDYSGISVSGAGDVNGDGFDDLIISDPDEQDSFGNAGPSSSYVMFGRASGFSAVADSSSLAGDEGFRLDGGRGVLVTSVSGAGDVNGDGFDDLIAGAPGADLNGKNSGSSYVIFGRSDFTSGPDFLGTPGEDVFTGTPAAESFVTLDGDDGMIGGGGADSFAGGAGDDVMQIADAGFVLIDGGTGFDTLELAGGGFNLNLSSAGDKMQNIEAIDMTGSGNHKLILSMQDVLNLSDETNTLRIKGDAGDSVAGLDSGWVDGGIQNGVRTYIQFDAVLQIDVAVSTDFVDDNAMSLFSLDGSNGFRLDGEAAHDESGRSVSNAGDVNGDGFDDVIVGAPLASSNSNYSGSSYVVFGQASGFNAAMSLSDLDGTNGFRLDGEAASDGSGCSVSSAGDVNGDGFDDLIVGSSYADPNGSLSGSSYVVFGKASGFDAAMNLFSLDGSNGFRLDGNAVYDRSGLSVSGAGDVNGDGFGDVIVGAYGADPSGNDSGSSYVIFGRASGFDAAMNLSSLDGSNGFRLDGETEHDESGRSVSSAGDVNGDGFDDVIITARYAFPHGYGSGSSYVVFGRASGFDAAMNLSGLDGSNGFRLDGVSVYDIPVSGAGDVNGDGFDDVIIGAPDADPNGSYSGFSYVVFGKASGFDATMDLSGLDGSNGFRLDGETEHDESGRSVSSAGDVNGDGFDDVIVDARDSSYVVFGRASGFDAVMNLSGLDGSDGFRIDRVTIDNFSPGSVSGAGDVNGDGFDDLIVGSPGANVNGANSGSSYVIFGRSDFTDGEVVDFPGTPGDDIFTGTKAAESFKGEAGNDRMIGRGGADSFDGGAGNDYIRILGDDFLFVDGGSGTDTLGLSGSGLNLDLPGVIDKIHGIETIALYGTGDNMLTLTAQDVIDLSGERNTLKIKGNAGDSVIGLSSGWTDGGIHGNFHTYTQGDAVLLIGVNVTTDFPVI